MLPGEFIRKLQQCNRNLRIFPSRNPEEQASGLYKDDCGLWTHLCGVDNFDVPENGVVDYVGHIIKRGWRATLGILIGKRLVDRDVAGHIFGTRFGPDRVKRPRLIGKKKVDLSKEIAKESESYKNNHGGDKDAIAMDSNLMGDFAHEIQKETPVKKPSLKDIRNGR